MGEKKMAKKMKIFLVKHPLAGSIGMAALGGITISFIYYILVYVREEWHDTASVLKELVMLPIFGSMIGMFLIFPILVTIYQVFYLLRIVRGTGKNKETDMETVVGKNMKKRPCLIVFDLVILAIGILYSLIYLSLLQEAVFQADWTETLYNTEKHTPINTQCSITILVFIGIGLLGYLVVNLVKLEKMPPLLLVLGMSAMYLATGLSIAWGIQVYDTETLMDLYLLLLPCNCVLITARVVSEKVQEWKEIPYEENEKIQEGILGQCRKLLEKSTLWPVLAFLFMIPLLGILIAILVLFGQAPDAVIRAFTQTSDWNLSQRVAPQNVMYDEHYLCTVAAGGHEKVVKPIRLGKRHGHEVIVNRQLCIANAFEQILEERTPRFHKVVRHFYDTCGFPVAKLIRSRCVADLVYFLMKPLEWFFLIVLYLTDAKPENRIAVQYLGDACL